MRTLREIISQIDRLGYLALMTALAALVGLLVLILCGMLFLTFVEVARDVTAVFGYDLTTLESCR